MYKKLVCIRAQYNWNALYCVIRIPLAWEATLSWIWNQLEMAISVGNANITRLFCVNNPFRAQTTLLISRIDPLFACLEGRSRVRHICSLNLRSVWPQAAMWGWHEWTANTPFVGQGDQTDCPWVRLCPGLIILCLNSCGVPAFSFPFFSSLRLIFASKLLLPKNSLRLAQYFFNICFITVSCNFSRCYFCTCRLLSFV